jgi:acyl-CoA synthetase (AMP-forming)/AMP-acid ligase II
MTGTTGRPKGVMVTQANILVRQAIQQDEDSSRDTYRNESLYYEVSLFGQQRIRIRMLRNARG